MCECTNPQLSGQVDHFAGQDHEMCAICGDYITTWKKVRMEAMAAAEEYCGLDYARNGVILQPGKYEMDMWYVPWFDNLSLEGMEDETIFDEYDRPISVFEVDDDMRRAFSLEEKNKVACLSSSDSGFIFMSLYTREEWNKVVSEMDAAIKEREEECSIKDGKIGHNGTWYCG